MKNTKIFRRILATASFTMLLLAFLSPILSSRANAAVCYAPNIAYCGASSPQDLVNKMANGDGRNGDIGTILENIGIFPNDIISPRMQNGQVHRDGTVWVGGQMVASNVVNGQRGTYGINGPSVSWDGLEWARPNENFKPSTSSLDAWVYMFNGQFKYAVIKDCGNPVLIHLVPMTPQLSIQKMVSSSTDATWRKANTANPGQTLKYEIYIKNIGEVTAEDVSIHDALPAKTILIPNTGKMALGSARVDSVTDNGIKIGVGFGNWAPGQDGRLTFEVHVAQSGFTSGTCENLVNTAFTRSNRTTEISDTATTQVCLQGKVPVTPKDIPETPPTPVVPQTTPTPTPTLPKAGPVEATAGAMGTAGLGYAGYLWRRSRKLLLDSLKKF